MVKFIIVERAICDAIGRAREGPPAHAATPAQRGYALGQSFGRRRR